jgi:hypothetical protein
MKARQRLLLPRHAVARDDAEMGALFRQQHERRQRANSRAVQEGDVDQVDAERFALLDAAQNRRERLSSRF